MDPTSIRTVFVEIKKISKSYYDFHFKARSKTEKILKITRELDTCVDAYDQRLSQCKTSGEIKLLTEGFQRDALRTINVKDTSQLPPDYEKFKSKIGSQLARLD